MAIDLKREIAVSAALKHIYLHLIDAGINRESLSFAQAILTELANERGYWFTSEFPPPDKPELTSFYLIYQDETSGYALYLNVMEPGEQTPIHNHTTWACIASVSGVETNYLYERLDDHAVEGNAEVLQFSTVRVGPGQSIGILPDDIHSVSNISDETVFHLHLYGANVESLRERLEFDVEKKTCSVMPIIKVDQRAVV